MRDRHYPLMPIQRVTLLFLNLMLYPCLLTWTLFCLAVGLSIMTFIMCLPREYAARATRFLIWLYGRGAMFIIGLVMSVRREGETSLPKPCILVANHQSIWDLYCMGLLPEFDVVMVVRNWPFRIPFFSLFMNSAGYIRSEDTDADELIRRGRKTLDSGASVLFFPEGHRNRNGQLGRFYSGAFKLSAETGVPVVPLCIEGTGTLLPPGEIVLRPSRISFRILPSAKAAGDPQHAHLMLKKSVKALMSETLHDMRKGRLTSLPSATLISNWRSL